MKSRRLARTLVGLLGLAAAECRAGAANDKHERQKMSDKPPVEIRYAGDRPGRPPQLRMQLDVVLRNSKAAPRWFLLPKSNQAPSGGVDVLEVYELTGKGRAVVGRFLGRAGFQALLLPPGAEVRLHNFPLSYWGERPHGTLPLEVITASDFSIGGQPARSWFAADPASAPGADVSEDKARAIGKHKTADGKEAPVSFTDEERLKIEVALPH